MKFSYNWLNEYFDNKLPAPMDLAEKIGLHSFELEGVEEIEFKGKKDFLIDWDVLPNRSSDCLAYEGIVKEISAILNLPAEDVLYQTENVKFDDSFKSSDFIALKVEDGQKVLRATKRLAINVKIGPSPDWLVEKLEAMGQKSINNVVDITNYVMWITGQPVHAFDFDKLAGGDKKEIFIRPAQEGEEVVDLSGNKHILNKNILVVADQEKALDIAGIKGGEISGVDENTSKILMSAVNFEYENIRNTARQLKLQTDASKRYENEVPLFKVERAMKLFGYLLQELAGAKVAEEIIDTNPDSLRNKKINISTEKINNLLGLKIETAEMLKILERLNFEIKELGNDNFEITIPEDRLDLNIWQDIAEEVGRIYGYQNIEDKFPTEAFPLPAKNILKNKINLISDILRNEGFFEVYNRSIVMEGEIKLKNSLNSLATCLRDNLLDGLKKKVEKNFTHSVEPKFFEIGKIFTSYENKQENKIIAENFSLAGIIGRKKIKEKNKEELFFQTKGVLEKIFTILNIKKLEWRESKEGEFLADIFSERNDKIGSVGINFWELNLEKLILNIDEKKEYKEISKYPKIERDIAFWTDLNYPFAKVEKIIKSVLGENLQAVELFDIYKDVENNRKSFAFKIIFQSLTETLSDDFANAEADKVYKILAEQGFEIR